MAKKKKEETPEVTQEVTTKETKSKTAKEAAVPEVEKEQEVKEKRAPQMITVNGDKVTHLHVFKSDRSEAWFIAAKINDLPLKPMACSPEDCDAIMKKEAKVEELMQKYYPTKVMKRLSADELKLPATIMGNNGQEMTINKFNVFKENNQEHQDYGKYKFYVDINGRKISTLASAQMLNEYFDRVKTPAQLVAQAFGEQLNLKAHYEQFQIPEGVDEKNIRISKNKETNRYEITVEIDGLKSDPKELSYNDRVSFFQKSATKEQLAAKYLSAEIPQIKAIMEESKKNEVKQAAPSLGL